VRLLLILRAAVFVGVGLLITFIQAHTYSVGVLALTIFAFAYALVSALALVVKGNQLPVVETLILTVFAVATGIAAIVTTPEASTWLVKLYAVWGIASGLTELAQAFRTGRKTNRGRELLISGALSFAFGLLFALVPLAELDTVGFFGAYLILSAVHLGIAAASERKTPSAL
jgi:uncharacterized membrane protein HdeD (DUF308 family)